MLSLDNICPHIKVAKKFYKFSLGYNQVYWVLQIAILENTHRFLVFLNDLCF